MELEELKEKISSTTDSSKFYLVEELSELSGFFVVDRKLIYAVKDIENSVPEDITTEALQFRTHVPLYSVENNQTFEDGFYNIIIYKDKTFSDEENLKSFIRICKAHSQNLFELSFKDYFYSLVSLFQPMEEQQYKNGLGLYGELKFMEYIYETTGKDISEFWHTHGVTSRADFENKNSFIEVKTTSDKHSYVNIKHDQVFNHINGYLGLVLVESTEIGETLEELKSRLLNTSNAFNCLSFTINLEKEIRRIPKNFLKETYVTIGKINLYETEKINPLNSVPYNISELKYKLDYVTLVPLNQKEISQAINSFKS